MKLYRLITSFLIMAAVAFATTASESSDNKQRPFPEDRIKQEAKYFTESLHLSGDSAARFTQIFTDYNMAIHRVLETHKTPPPQYTAQQYSRQSQEKIEKNIKARFACARAILDIRENFYYRFREILSPSQYESFTILEQKIGAKKRHEHQRRRLPQQTKESKKSNKKK